MSYDGHLGFGLLGDYDALADIETIAKDLEWAISQLVKAAGLRPARKRPAARKAPAARKNSARARIESGG
jgi:hypothetical protein